MPAPAVVKLGIVALRLSLDHNQIFEKIEHLSSLDKVRFMRHRTKEVTTV